MPVVWAVIVALIIASFKGSLVAAIFMHLSHERKAIYWVLILTVVFFIVLMAIPDSLALGPDGTCSEPVAAVVPPVLHRRLGVAGGVGGRLGRAELPRHAQPGRPVLGVVFFLLGFVLLIYGRRVRRKLRALAPDDEE